MPSVGWRGYIMVGGLPLAVTRNDLAEAQALLVADDIIAGGGISATSGVYASDLVAAVGAAEYRGTLAGQVFAGTGNFATALKSIVQRAVGASASDISLRETGFNAATPLVASPDGNTKYTYPNSAATYGKVVVHTMNFRGTTGALAEWDAEVVSVGRETYVGSAPAVGDFSYESATPAASTPANDDSNPLPFYSVTFDLNNSGESDIDNRVTDWNLAIANNTSPITTFNGTNYITDIIVGKIGVTGSFTYYGPSTLGFVERLNNGADLTITFGSGFSLTMQHLMFAEMPLPMVAPNTPVTRTVNFTALAHPGGTSPSIYYTGL